MKPLAAVLALSGIMAVAVALLGVRSALVPPAAGPPPADASQAAAPAGLPAGTDAESPTPSVRLIAPDRVATPDVDPSALQREAPRPPLSKAAAPAIPQRQPTTLIFNPIADAAGRVSGQGVRVTLFGIRVIEPDQTCTDEDGRQWPCGMVARTAFRSLLRGRALDCVLPRDPAIVNVAAPCSLGKLDVASWVVSNGWAIAAPGGPYEKEGKAARERHLGIYGEAPAPVVEFQALSEPPPLAGAAPVAAPDRPSQ